MHFLFCFDIPKKTTIPDNTKSKTDVSAQHIINYQLILTHEFSYPHSKQIRLFGNSHKDYFFGGECVTFQEGFIKGKMREIPLLLGFEYSCATANILPFLTPHQKKKNIIWYQNVHL